jgi:tetratricopeptide (TPR) repeat protein
LQKAIAIWEEAIDHYLNAGREDSAARLYGESANALSGAPRTEQRLNFARQKAAGIEDLQDGPGHAFFLHELARLFYFNDMPIESEAISRRALAMSRKVGAISVQIDSLITLALSGGQFSSERIGLQDEAVELAKKHDLPAQEARARNNRAVYRVYSLGDFLGAYEDYNRGVELSHRIGDLYQEQFWLGGSVFASIYLADYGSSETMLKDLGQMLEETVDPGPLFLRYSMGSAMLDIYRGEHDEALIVIQEISRKAQEQNHTPYIIWADLATSRVMLARGESTQAISSLEAALSLSGGVEDYYDHRVRSELIVAYSMGGDIDLADKLVNESEIKIQEAGSPPYDGAHFSRAKAHYAAAVGSWTESWRYFEQAIEAFKEMRLPWHQAKTMEEWAEAHLLRGLPEDKNLAKELYEGAAQGFEDIDLATMAASIRNTIESL